MPGKAISVTYSECATVVSFIQQTTRLRHIVLSSVTCLAPTYFSTFSHKRLDFQKKNPVENKECVLIFSKT